MTLRTQKGIFCLLMTLFLFFTGCANLHQMKPLDKATMVAHESVVAFEQLHTQYLQVYGAASLDHQAWMKEHAGPVLDLTRDSLVILVEAVMVWHSTGAEPSNFAELQTNFNSALVDSMTLVAAIVNGEVF